LHTERLKALKFSFSEYLFIHRAAGLHLRNSNGLRKSGEAKRFKAYMYMDVALYGAE
jgi:hypothetical protein